MLEQTAVLYHKDCPDGWTAAWVAHNALIDDGEDVTLIPVTHGDPPPDLSGIDTVYIVDFSYRHDVLVELTDSGKRLVAVLDHHQSAIDDICGHDEIPYKTDLDNNRSGAGITWDFFHNDEPRPPIVDYVEDRDLWRWALPDSREFNAYIKTQPYTIEAWNALTQMSFGDIRNLGVGALAQVDAYCRAAASHAYICTMGGREFPIVNVTYESCSDVASHILNTTDYDMAGYFFERGQGGWHYGFRSRNRVTVHDFAKQFGGGGHPQASGCVADHLLHTRV